MKRICSLTCLMLLTFNLIDAFQRAKPESYKNYGEDEQYSPSYMRSYQSSSPYGYLIQNERPFDNLDPLEPFQFSSTSWNDRKNILFNGPDQWNKYKNYNKLREESENKFRPTREELNRLLASIQNIKPSSSNDDEKAYGDLVREDNRFTTGVEQFEPNRRNNIFITNRYPVLYRRPPVDNSFDYGNIDYKKPNYRKLIKTNPERQQQQQPMYLEENIAIPFDRMEMNKNIKKSSMNEEKPTETTVRNIVANKESKIRRKYPNAALISNSQHIVRTPKAYQQPINGHTDSTFGNLSDIYFIAIVACVSTVAIFSVIGAGYCFYKVQQSNKAATEVDFPSYGVIGPARRTETNDNSKCSSPSNDRKLVQSAQIYHYHHQKQQMISTEKNSVPKNNVGSDIESDEENEDGEYTVYECPGLAPTGEMEIKNPLFQDDLTPMSSPSVNNSPGSKNTSPKSVEENNVTNQSLEQIMNEKK